MVFLDGHESSYVDLADPTHLEFSYMRRIGDVIDLIRPARQPLDVLHVGGGGFTLPRYVAATRPRSRQVVFEYDAELVRIAREHLGLAASPGLRVRVGDARARLAERPDASADLVIGDAFSGVVVPAHLATLEFAREVRRVLRPDGVYLLNVIDCPPLRVSRAEAATLLAAFGEIGLVADRDLLRERDAGNVVFMAAGVPLPLDGVRRGGGAGRPPGRRARPGRGGAVRRLGPGGDRRDARAVGPDRAAGRPAGPAVRRVSPLDKPPGVDLSQRAAEAGVATSYLDWARRRVDVPPAAVGATLELVGSPPRHALVTAGPSPVAGRLTLESGVTILTEVGEPLPPGVHQLADGTPVVVGPPALPPVRAAGLGVAGAALPAALGPVLGHR
jgi:SAM-dependent methyltransferase